MGQSQSLSTSIEIHASPETVREVFMNFPAYKQWTNWSFEPIPDSSTPSTSSQQSQSQSQIQNENVSLVSDKTNLKIDLNGMTFRPVVKELTSTSFAWEGSLYGLLVGRHEFLWSTSSTSTSTTSTNSMDTTMTTTVQRETFQGILAFIMAPPAETWFGLNLGLRESTLKNWDGFFQDLKRECEKREGGQEQRR